MVRALLEGVAFALRQIVDVMVDAVLRWKDWSPLEMDSQVRSGAKLSPMSSIVRSSKAATSMARNAPGSALAWSPP